MGNFHFNGIIDQVRVYNRALTGREVKEIYDRERNRSPIIHSFTANPIAGAPPLEVNFTCNASDPDGTVAEYRWDFDGDGTVDSTTETNTATHTYGSLGRYDATVTAVDNLGATTKSEPVTINVAYGPDLTGKLEEFHAYHLLNKLVLKFRAENSGTLPAGGFKVSFYLSDDGIKPILPAFREVAVPGGLAAGANTLLAVSRTFPGSIYGKYVLILVDKADQVAEINETNNGARMVVQLVKEPPATNKNGTMTCSLTADPLAGAPPLLVKFTASATHPDHTITQYRWDFDGDGTIDKTTSTRITNHTYNDLGSYDAKVTAVSSSEATCRAGPLKINVAYGPDLTGKAEEFHFKQLFNSVNVTFRARNVGTVAAPGFKVSFHLPSDGTTPLEPPFKVVDVPGGLAAGASALLRVSNTFPRSIYGKHVLIVIDKEDQVAEIDDRNNTTREVVQPLKTK